VIVCGKGELDAELKSLSSQLGLDDIVSFAGFVSEADKAGYMAAATIMAFPSTGGESFGIVLIEAMAAGGPLVLAADNPGYASVMQPQPGLLFTVGDAMALADRMLHYLHDRSDRQTMLDWQQQYIGQFDIAVVGRSLLADYTQQLQKKRQT
jgi:phosphatidylinositol alpha-mannosyltransferase